MKSRLTSFLDTAYEYQRGQFYPERHEENLQRLAIEFPIYDKDLRDCLYRLAVHLDTTSANLASGVAAESFSKEDGLEQLSVSFFHFSETTRQRALDHAIDILATRETR